MPSINMIAPRRAEKRRLESNVRRLLIAIVVEVALVALVGGFMMSQIYRTRSMAQSLDVQLTKLQPTVSKIQSFEKMTKGLGPKLDTLNDAKTDTFRWCRVMHNLSLSVPDHTWFTRISTEHAMQDADTVKVNINGLSISQEMVGLTMLRLHDNVPDFSTVDLQYTQKASAGSMNGVEFEVAAGIQLPKKDDKEVAKS